VYNIQSAGMMCSMFLYLLRRKDGSVYYLEYLLGHL
jgi:hypothetical protein